MLGDISDEEVNELIVMFSQSVLGNFLTRGVVESKIFPVNHYIHVACYILYDQSYQYNILKEVASKISPEDLAKRSKSLGSRSNHLGFYSLLMLYLHGRAEIIHDNLSKKKAGDTNIVVEPETKKNETKFIMDFWKRLSPNYLNGGEQILEKSKKITCLSDDYIENLKENMISIDNNKDIIKQLKQTIAHLTIYSFLSQAECRMSISEQGPYYFEGNTEPLVFKEFLDLHTGDDMFGINMSGNMPYKITPIAPVPNVIFGMTLKDMNKIEFNDFGTLFADPTDLSSNITSVGTKKLMFGSNLYVNRIVSLCAQYAGIEEKFNWTWPFDYVSGKPFKTNLVDKEKITFYIDKLGKKVKANENEKEAEKLQIASLEKYEGIHPFLTRMFRSRRARKLDPFYYYLQDD